MQKDEKLAIQKEALRYLRGFLFSPSFRRTEARIDSEVETKTLESKMNAAGGRMKSRN